MHSACPAPGPPGRTRSSPAIGTGMNEPPGPSMIGPVYMLPLANMMEPEPLGLP